ncbi:MAG TPA: phenylalanine--tRNA ligase subunit alpha [Candidatus Nitrosotenuis sp.]|nr:phenylalanine--tRNA ligase subunit alpha [Candidatus Nitrosotenuis sp.]
MIQHQDLLERLEALRQQSRRDLEEARTLEQLEEIRVRVLGRKGGELNAILRGLAQLPPEERPVAGQKANQVKEELEALLEERTRALQSQALQARLEEERLDVTLPGRWPPPGRLHILNQVLRQIKEIFRGLGFAVVQGPDIETDYYNFEALNIPADHAAREMWDSFYLREGLLLRSHTSPVQVRVMEKTGPPVRIVVPGRCYRRDAVDATHFWMFHQVEGLLVDEGVSFAELKGTLEMFARALYGQRRRARFTPSYFPFTEPSAEMAIDCFACSGQGCRLCKQSGWIEILGCGMVHPRVLERVGYDTERYTGYAFGMGVERIAMLSYGIPDIRLLFEGDERFLRQF